MNKWGKVNWQFLLIFILISLSAVFYFIHFIVYDNAEYIFNSLLARIAFVPIQVLLIALGKDQSAKPFSKDFQLKHGIGPSSSIKASLDSLLKKGIRQWRAGECMSISIMSKPVSKNYQHRINNLLKKRTAEYRILNRRITKDRIPSFFIRQSSFAIETRFLSTPSPN